MKYVWDFIPKYGTDSPTKVISVIAEEQVVAKVELTRLGYDQVEWEIRAVYPLVLAQLGSFEEQSE